MVMSFKDKFLESYNILNKKIDKESQEKEFKMDWNGEFLFYSQRDQPLTFHDAKIIMSENFGIKTLKNTMNKKIWGLISLVTSMSLSLILI